MLKVAISLCPNDIYCFAGILLDEISHPYTLKVLELGQLNQLLPQQSFDFIKVSASSYLLHQKDYLATSVGASLATGKGPQLVSALHTSAPEKSKQATCVVPSLASTSAQLIRYFYPKCQLYEEPLLELTQKVALKHYDYGVIVNETQEGSLPRGLQTILDLSHLWHTQTGVPLPLGIIAASRRLEAPRQVKEFEKTVQNSILWAQNHHSEALALTCEYSVSHDTQANEAHIQKFCTHAFKRKDISHLLNVFEHQLKKNSR
ncbi:MAG: hypothetical protein OXT67_04975 [Zetaproteobacteria bacterium]|nr:hypothetical protein [Zetaproteobacteria bacterium]